MYAKKHLVSALMKLWDLWFRNQSMSKCAMRNIVMLFQVPFHNFGSCIFISYCCISLTNISSMKTLPISNGHSLFLSCLSHLSHQRRKQLYSLWIFLTPEKHSVWNLQHCLLLLFYRNTEKIIVWLAVHISLNRHNAMTLHNAFLALQTLQSHG